MKHTYNNWSCKIFEGFYESNLYNSDSLYWITKNDIDEGYLQKNQYYDIDNWEQFTKDIVKQAVYKLWEILPDNDIIQDMELKDIYSPKYYNYETDSDFEGYDTSYHYNLYEAANEVIYNHLAIMEDTPKEVVNELAF